MGKNYKIIYLQRKIYLVENLKVNLLFNIDILAPEIILIDLENRLAIIRLYELI